MATLAPPSATLNPAEKAGAPGADITQSERNRCNPDAGGRPVLEVSDLEISTTGPRETPLLETLSLEIRDGEFFALVGESGSGKSLLCSALMGILPANLRATGDVLFDGKPLANADRSARAMIFQQPNRYLNPVRTIGFQLAETVAIVSNLRKREARDRAASLLDAVGIDDPRATLKKYPHELSGGMNQRVMMALALARQPRLLIADEPTSALDVTTQRQIMDLIERLRDDWNMAVLFVTHDLDLAVERSDRIGVIYAGQLVEIGPTRALAGQPRHPYTRTLFSAVPAISLAPPKLAALAGGVPDPSLRGNGCHFASRCSSALDNCKRIRPTFATDVSHTAACHNLGGSDATF
ncbi:ABC transporter ATP-binding protein [Microvirga sp. VF16]|uniref:ABC transporter ATP-binding protein n=1 Tax=Microvirga sp. VF16 TaxID=2807101 RepID=UPI001FED7AC6|nr:ABC transporter ATP-binding protein [Microvirga sp. VF16]